MAGGVGDWWGCGGRCGLDAAYAVGIGREERVGVWVGVTVGRWARYNAVENAVCDAAGRWAPLAGDGLWLARLDVAGRVALRYDAATWALDVGSWAGAGPLR